MCVVYVGIFLCLIFSPCFFLLTSLNKYLLQEALKRRLNARIEYAKFLQDTAKEMAKEVQNTRSGEIKKTAEDLDDFLSKASVQGSRQLSSIVSFLLLICFMW